MADDWPISYDDLKPYHDEVDEFIGVSGVGGDTAYPEVSTNRCRRTPKQTRPEGRRGREQARLALVARHQRHPEPKYKTLEQCGRWGSASGAARRGQGVLRPDLPAAGAAAGAEVITGARVGKVVTDDEGTVRSIPHR